MLWVALASRLGPTAGGADQAAPLVLQAATGSLSLVDAAGQRRSGTSLRLRWREVPLAKPLLLGRSVLGPFASFESAEQAAMAWRALGVEAQIGYPKDWEVWAVASSKAPQGFQARTDERLVTSGLALEAPAAAGGGSRTATLLEGPMLITAPGGLRWQGGVFPGPFRLQPDAYGGWSLIEQVPLERYLLGVVPHEIGAASPPAALAAQAVLARTWALRNRHRFAIDGYHLCADTQCQVYGDPAWRAEPWHGRSRPPRARCSAGRACRFTRCITRRTGGLGGVRRGLEWFRPALSPGQAGWTRRLCPAFHRPLAGRDPAATPEPGRRGLRGGPPPFSLAALAYG